MKNFGAILLTIGAMMLAGCASGPTYEEQTARMQPVAAENGRIYLYRKSALGAAIQPIVQINGKSVGRAQPGGFFYVDLPPGAYDIAVSTEVERNLNVVLDTGEEKYVRLEVKMGFFVGHVKPVLVDKDVGMGEIMKMKYIGDGS